MNDEEVKLADWVREFYRKERSVHDSMLSGEAHEYRVPKHYDGRPAAHPYGKPVESIWIKLARELRKRKVEPFDYLRFHFSECGLGRPPEPTHLLSDGHFALYETRREKGEGIDMDLATQASLASTNISYQRRFMERSYDDACAIVILDPGLNLSTLFRYCMARTFPGKRFAAIAAKLEGAAVMQYLSCRGGYDKDWKSVLPKGFRQLALEIYGKLTAF